MEFQTGRRPGRQVVALILMAGAISLAFPAIHPVRGADLDSTSRQSLDPVQHRAAAGDPKAQSKLGDYLFARGDYTNAVTWYRRAAVQGEPGAQMSLANCYARGLGVPKNPDEAAKWTRVARFQSAPKTPAAKPAALSAAMSAVKPSAARLPPVIQAATRTDRATTAKLAGPSVTSAATKASLTSPPLTPAQLTPSLPPSDSTLEPRVKRIRILQPQTPELQDIALSILPSDSSPIAGKR